MSRRTDRVGDLLRVELSEILLRRIHDPRIRLAAITQVETSPDLRHAVVQVSVVGTESERDACLVALRKARGFVRSELARSLKRMKTIPELRFELDRGAEYSQRISDLLETPDEHDETP